MDMVQVEVWVKVDEDGDYYVNADRDELDDTGNLATRIVKIVVNVPKPQPVELEAEIEAEPETAELKVA